MRPVTASLTGATWFKSSFSGGTNGSCVEAAFGHDAVGVRDTKQQGKGPVLVFRPAEWSAFVSAVRTGEFEPS